jgi:hypothetical protein
MTRIVFERNVLYTYNRCEENESSAKEKSIGIGYKGRRKNEHKNEVHLY